MAGDWTIRSLDLRLDGLLLPMGLLLDEAVLHGADVSVQTEPFLVSLGSDASATVRVSCESIQRYLSTLGISGLRDVTVETEGGLLKVSATAVVLVPIRAVAYCDLAVSEGTKLDIVLKGAEPGAAAGLIEKQLKSVNPVLDLSGLFVKVVIDRVEIADGWVVLNGVGG